MATINGTGSDETINGTISSDLINGLGGRDTIFGLGNDDTINGGNGRDDIYGGGGNDNLRGDAGADHLDGGDHADWLNGGEDADFLTGGGGNDNFFFDSTAKIGSLSVIDTIMDFVHGTDKIYLDDDLIVGGYQFHYNLDLDGDGQFDDSQADVRNFDNSEDMFRINVLNVNVDSSDFFLI